MAATIHALPVRREQPDVQEILRQFNNLKQQRDVWDNHWQEVKERVWPHGADFITQRTPGDKRTEHMLDATAALALEKFSAALESLLTPRQQEWHRLTATDEELDDDSEVKEWLELATKSLFKARNAPRAGYYEHAHEGYKSLGAYGNTCMFIDSRAGGGLRYMHCSVASIYIALDQWGQVDTIFRCYKKTAKQAFQTWGEDAPEKAIKALAANPWAEHEYLHVVRPNKWRDTEAIGQRGMPWESIHLCVDDKCVLEVGGYVQMPYLYSRYTVNPAEPYGRSPAMLVLANIKILQEQQRTFLRAGHKLVDPPLLIHDDGVLGTGGKAIRLRPGGLNYGGLDSQGRHLIAPLQTGGRLDLTFEMMERERQFVNEAFLVTLFAILVDHPQMTATEALIRAQEKGELLAPAIGRQQAEMLGPQVERELYLLLTAGDIPPPPPQLVEYEIEYESPATQMQKAAAIVGISRTIEVVAPFLQADPGLFLKFNAALIIDEAAAAQGVPLKVIRTEDEYLEARAAFDKAQQMAQMVQMGQGVASAANDVAGAQQMAQQGAPGVA